MYNWKARSTTRGGTWTATSTATRSTALRRKGGRARRPADPAALVACSPTPGRCWPTEYLFEDTALGQLAWKPSSRSPAVPVQVDLPDPVTQTASRGSIWVAGQTAGDAVERLAVGLGRRLHGQLGNEHDPASRLVDPGSTLAGVHLGTQHYGSPPRTRCTERASLRMGRQLPDRVGDGITEVGLDSHVVGSNACNDLSTANNVVISDLGHVFADSLNAAGLPGWSRGVRSRRRCRR